ncbi:MAG: hypothetical protein IKU52_05155 [Clostridia bacterium]|nr:hypothetical protein [Clostridia bacterium]
MTVGDIIFSVEKSRPGCDYSMEFFLDEINRTWLDIHQNIISAHEGGCDYSEFTCAEDIIGVPNNYTDLFKYRLIALIDINNGDVKRYSNNMILYNNLLSAYGEWYTRNHIPKQKAKLRWM